MPIKIPNNLPAAEVLQQENIFVMHENKDRHGNPAFTSFG